MIQFSSAQFSHSVVSEFLATPWIAARQASLCITNSRSSLRLTSIDMLLIMVWYQSLLASQVVLVVKNPPAKEGDPGDAGSILGSGRFPGGEHGNPLQCSCLENPVDRGDRQAKVHGQGVICDWSDLVCTHLVDKTETGFKSATLILKAVLLWIKCY